MSLIPTTYYFYCAQIHESKSTTFVFLILFKNHSCLQQYNSYIWNNTILVNPILLMQVMNCMFLRRFILLSILQLKILGLLTLWLIICLMQHFLDLFIVYNRQGLLLHSFHHFRRLKFKQRWLLLINLRELVNLFYILPMIFLFQFKMIQR